MPEGQTCNQDSNGLPNLLNKGYTIKVGLKTNYIEYEDIERPLRSHLEIGIDEKISAATISEKLIYHRNEFNRQDSYQQLINDPVTEPYFTFDKEVLHFTK